ncbi:MAG: hypothetical protein U5L09_13625 [Bacteroidales bacterium]|nr:hypothetical protein [Bacteroidales bacterium]
MPEDKKHIDSLFREGLYHVDEKAPTHSWEVLSERLDYRRKMRRMRIIRYAAASVAILLAFFIGREFSGDTTTPMQVADNTSSSSQRVEDQRQLFTESSFTEVASINIPAAKSTTTKASRGSGEREMTSHASASSAQPSNTREVRILETIHTLSPYKAALKTSLDISRLNIPKRILKRMLDDRIEHLSTEASHTTQLASSQTGWSVGGFLSPLYLPHHRKPIVRTVRQLLQNQQRRARRLWRGARSLMLQEFRHSAPFSEKWHLETGLSYTRMGQSKNALVYEQTPDDNGKIDLSTSAGRINGSKMPSELGQQFAANNPSVDDNDRFITDNETNTELQQHFDYIEIPLLMKYNVYQEQIAINLISGISTGIMVNNNAVVTIDGTKSDLGTTSNIRKYLYSSVVGFGMHSMKSLKECF